MIQKKLVKHCMGFHLPLIQAIALQTSFWIKPGRGFLQAYTLKPKQILSPASSFTSYLATYDQSREARR